MPGLTTLPTTSSVVLILLLQDGVARPVVCLLPAAPGVALSTGGA